MLIANYGGTVAGISLLIGQKCDNLQCRRYLASERSINVATSIVFICCHFGYLTEEGWKGGAGEGYLGVPFDSLQSPGRFPIHKTKFRYSKMAAVTREQRIIQRSRLTK